MTRRMPPPGREQDSITLRSDDDGVRKDFDRHLRIASPRTTWRSVKSERLEPADDGPFLSRSRLSAWDSATRVLWPPAELQGSATTIR
jgi:hypothetical protein